MKKFSVAILLFFSAKTVAQVYSYNDAQFWFNLYLEKKVSDHWKVHLNQQDRWTENVSRFNFAYADVGLTYKFNKWAKLLVDYVFTQKYRPDESFGTIHQYYVALSLKKDFGRWRFAYRNMIQFQFNNPYTSYYALTPFWYERNKFIVKWFYNKYFTFYAAEELYIPINSPQITGIDRNRTFAGLFYTVVKHQQLELYFMHQNRIQNGTWFKQHNTFDPARFILEKDFVYGIGYSIEF